MTVPPPTSRVASTVVRFDGEAGRAWLAALPAILSDVVDTWDLRVEEPYPFATVAYVAPVRQADGTPAVLKVLPFPERAAAEAEAFRVWAGAGAARLLAARPEKGAILLERFEPGEALEMSPAPTSRIEVACRVLTRLWATSVPSGTTLARAESTVTEQAAELRRLLRAGRLRNYGDLIEDALRTIDRLMRGTERIVVLHGDLHVGNILRSNRDGWLAIDPQPLLGDPAFDTAPLIRSSLSHPPTATAASSLVGTVARSLHLDPERVRDWAFLRHVRGAIAGAEVDASWARALHPDR